MTFPILSRSDNPKIPLTYPNLYLLATQAPDQDLAFWTHGNISSQDQFELLYKHASFPEIEMNFTEMRMSLLFAFYMTTW